MHILAAIVGLVGAFGAYWFFFRRAADAAGEAVNAAQTIRGAFKRRAFRKRTEESVLAGIDSPAVAAAVLLCRIGQAGERYDDVVKARIRAMLVDDMRQAQADDKFAFADWAAQGVVNDNDIARRFADLWRGALADRELAELRDMAREISRIHAPENQAQRDMLSYLEQKLGLPQP